MRPTVRWPVVHGVLFYLVWFLVVSAESSPGGDGIALMVQIGFALLALLVSGARASRELMFALLLGLFGSIVDSIPIAVGLAEFPHATRRVVMYPVWLTLMWICFATAFSTSLGWLDGRKALQAAFGVIGGVLSILAAERFGAVVFPEGWAPALFVYGIEWGAMMVAAFALHRRVMSSGIPQVQKS